jgi:hypothetical protein
MHEPDEMRDMIRWMQEAFKKLSAARMEGKADLPIEHMPNVVAMSTEEIWKALFKV